MSVYARVCRFQQRPEEGAAYLGIVITGSCKPPDGGVRKQHLWDCQEEAHARFLLAVLPHPSLPPCICSQHPSPQRENKR